MSFARFCRPFFFYISFGILLSQVVAAKSKKETESVAEAYKGAIVINAADGTVLFESKAGVQTPPASMTKLMTYAVLDDLVKQGHFDFSRLVEVVAADAKMGGTQVWLKEGEVFPAEELVYAMLIQSANDAAHALARVAAGSVQGFVNLMNAKAKSLGMNQTVFRTPHGLPPQSRSLTESDLTSPRDFALLCRYLVSHTQILKYTSIRLRPFGAPVRLQNVEMKNHNGLLGKSEGVDGLKTGYTAGAGFCLSATAERGGRRVIVVIMGSPASKARDAKVLELFEIGFAKLPPGSPRFEPAPRSGLEASGVTAAPLLPEDKGPVAVPTTKDSEPKITVPSFPARKSKKP